MTFEEALLTLEIGRDSDEKAARRAYLRLIKKHSPERDPSGFQRIRAAYDLVHANSYLLAQSPAMSEERAPASPQESASSAGSVVQAESQETQRDQIRQIEEASQRVLAAQNRARELRTQEAYELWLEVAEEAELDHDCEPASIAKEAVAEGHQSFIDVWRTRTSDRLSDDEIETWQRDLQAGRSQHWMPLAWALLERGQVEAAVSTTLARLEHERQRADFEYNDWFYTNFALAVFERGDRVQAQRLLDRYTKLDARSSRASPLQFIMLRELGVISALLPDELLRAIASGVRQHRPEDADPEFELYRRQVGWWRAPALTKRMKADAPTLFALYRPYLPRRFQRSSLSWSWWHGLFLTQLLLAVLRVCARTERAPPPPPKMQQSPPPLHVEARAIQGQAVVMCMPNDDELCRMVQMLAGGDECTLALTVADELRDATTQARIQGRLQKGDLAAIATLRERTYARCMNHE